MTERHPGMYTRCPQCRTHFRVRSEHLRAAGGNVRCSLCHHTFNALESLSESLPDSARTTEPPEIRRSDLPRGESAGERTGDMFEDLTPEAEDDPSGEQRAESGNEPSLSDLGSLAPRKRPLWQKVAWSLGTVVLGLTLAGQLVHAHRDQLARQPGVGPLVERTYALLGVPEKSRTSLYRFRIYRTEMLAPPEQPGALVLTGLLRNTADFEQRLPHLYVRVEDRWGRRVGHRFAGPAEYLPDNDRGLAALSSDSEIAIRMALRDPGPAAVGFSLQACAPRGGRYLCASEFRPPGI